MFDHVNLEKCSCGVIFLGISLL
uniref:Uncharacterized protein n=1 Tax=Anguilla anguilla TaxID=7936 RepID=A0A0E9QZU8_ANGAN